MSLNSFKHLIECQSVDLLIKKHLDNISEQNARIDYLEKIQQARLVEKEELQKMTQILNKEIAELEKELYSFESQKNKALENLNSISTEQQEKALTREIQSLTPQIEEIEIDILEKLETISNNESEIADSAAFLKGSKETLEEIKKEVQENIQVEDVEIKKYEERIRLLLDDVEENFKKMYLQKNEKLRFKKPLSFAIGNKCSECKFQISSVLVAQIEQGQAIEYCSGCTRILSPIS